MCIRYMFVKTPRAMCYPSDKTCTFMLDRCIRCIVTRQLEKERVCAIQNIVQRGKHFIIHKCIKDVMKHLHITRMNLVHVVLSGVQNKQYNQHAFSVHACNQGPDNILTGECFVINIVVSGITTEQVLPITGNIKIIFTNERIPLNVQSSFNNFVRKDCYIHKPELQYDGYEML